jgi:hypothetical protein
MRFSRPAALLAMLVTGACSTPPGATVPSLAPRAAENIDPRVPVDDGAVQMPVDAALAARLAELVGIARQGDSAFAAAAGEAQRLTAAAGAPQSESWVVAQQAVSAAVAARGPTARALGDIDALAAAALVKRGGIGPSDLAAIEGAAAEVGAIDRRQAGTIDALQRRLGG